MYFSDVNLPAFCLYFNVNNTFENIPIPVGGQIDSILIIYFKL